MGEVGTDEKEKPANLTPAGYMLTKDPLDVLD